MTPVGSHTIAANVCSPVPCPLLEVPGAAREPACPAIRCPHELNQRGEEKLQMRRSRAWMVVAVSAIAALLAGCGGSGSSSSSGGGGSASSGASKSPVVIGASLSLYGDFASDGQNFQTGYTLWA